LKANVISGQWLHYDIINSLPYKKGINRKRTNSRYDDIISIYGKEVLDNLKKQKVFIVGAGALGCELLKCFALLGIGTDPKGKVAITDNDHIELSNLNRQFLFRNTHIKKPKSKIASKEVEKINPSFKPQAFEHLVSPDTENIFDEKFWASQNFIVNAVDNRKARLYIDSKCVWHKKALFDSGTLGTKANTQLVIPHLTECYADGKDPEEESIPMCTLRNFPNQIEHCIEWGRNRFNDFFVEGPANLKSFLKNREQYLSKLQKENPESVVVKELRTIKQMMDLEQFEDWVGFAKQRLFEDYELQIENLIEMFPEDHKDSGGNKFWSGPKRFPTPIEFDPDDELQVDYIVSWANLIAECLDIDKVEDEDEIIRFAEEAEVDDEVKPDDIQLDEEEEKAGGVKKTTAQKNEEIKEEIKELIADIEDIDIDEEDINPEEFEKDDDENNHIDFIHAAANLRAQNYKLEECDKFKSKLIAGRIVPAIATTTATIVGAVWIEILKLAQGFEDIEDYRNTYLNLALSLFVQNEPGEPKKMKDVEMDPIMLMPVKAIPKDWTIWDIIEIKGPLTIDEFCSKIKKKYDVEVNIVTSGDKVFYNPSGNKKKMQARQIMKIEDIDREMNEKSKDSMNDYLILDIGGVTKKDKTEVSMPKIKYTFKK